MNIMITGVAGLLGSNLAKSLSDHNVTGIDSLVGGYIDNIILSSSSSGCGIAFARYKNIGNYVAVIARVRVAETIRLEHVYAAIDCGRVVNPDGVINQAEGGIVQAASWTLKEQLRFDRTRITSRSWEDYPILTFSEVPRIETVLLDRPDEAWLGVGEGMVGPTAAAIGNAVANALGVRLYDLPMTRERVIAALNR